MKTAHNHKTTDDRTIVGKRVSPVLARCVVALREARVLINRRTLSRSFIKCSSELVADRLEISNYHGRIQYVAAADQFSVMSQLSARLQRLTNPGGDELKCMATSWLTKCCQSNTLIRRKRSEFYLSWMCAL